MNVDIAFKEMDPSDAIKTLTLEKSGRLAKYFQGRTHVTWHFCVEKTEHVARCHLVGNNMDYHGEARTEDLYKSIDEALKKVERQIRKHKEIVTDHMHRNGHRTPQQASGE
jgi:putative sigma-54 modulation protein